MNIFKQIVLIALIIAINISLYGQSKIIIEGAQIYSTFKFIDANGNYLSNEYLGKFTNAYNIGYSYKFDFGLFVRPAIGMRNTGAEMVYDNMNYSWQLQYASAKLGIGYMFDFEKVKPYLMISGYFAYLVNGNQIVNNEHFNIIQNNLLKTIDYGIIASPGLEVKISNEISTYFEFDYLMGLNNIEINQSQKTTNISYCLTLGLSFALTNESTLRKR
jgi:hypothetical protein